MTMRKNLSVLLFSAFTLCLTATAVRAMDKATGGDDVYDYATNGIVYRVHVFTNNGAFELLADVDLDVLMVGGGGGGGYGYYGGGGGAGRLLDWSGTLGPSNYPVVVGAGGASATVNSANASNGGNSTFNNLIALGGGGGASRESGDGSAGGSGGGSSALSTLGGAADASQGGFGNAGGGDEGYYGGGGGGAGQPASWSTSIVGGNGGDGLQRDITGVARYYAGGGGGGGSASYSGAGDGGLGGGGDGGIYGGTAPTAGTPNTGGGGGGHGSQAPGADGGSGIVIVRYRSPLSVSALDASGVGTTGATMNGVLGNDDGDADTTVAFCWSYAGDTGTGSTSDWPNVVSLGGGWSTGESFSTNVTGISSGSNVFYRCYATNSTGDAWSDEVSYFVTAPVTVHVNPTTIGENAQTAIFTFFRPLAATNMALTVNYTTNGTATPSTDYEALETFAVTMLAGATSATVEVTTLMDGETEGDETLILELIEGTYPVGSPASATLTITNVIPGINTSIADGDWNSLTTWSEGFAPVAGQAVVATHALMLANSTPQLSSFTMTGGNLTFSNWTTRLRADTVDIQGGTLTLPAAFADGVMSNRVWIVCTNFTLGAEGLIDVDQRGYASDAGPGSCADVGAQAGPGAGHGGNGGITDRGVMGGTTYGSPEAPEAPGSGSAGTYKSYQGAKGGGAVRIEAGNHVLVNGTITADGENAAAYIHAKGGGAGGSVWITCHTFAGTNGLISADGGAGDVSTASYGAHGSGGGGGGRIAVEYDTEAQSSLPAPAVRFTADAGRHGYTGYTDSAPPPLMVSENGDHFARSMEADWGSLYFSDASGVVSITESITNIAGYLTFGNNVTNFSLAGLTLDNASFGFDTNATISIAGDLEIAANAALLARHPLSLTVSGNTAVRGTLRIDQASMVNLDGNVAIFDGGTFGNDGLSTLNIGGILTITGANANAIWRGADATVGGNVLLRDSGWLAALGTGTNGTVADASMRLSVAGDLLLESNSWVYVYSDPVEGGAVAFYCRNLSVPLGAGFNGDLRGFDEGQGEGASASIKYNATGAGYGGAGGSNDSIHAVGSPYGNADFPVDAGSGAGRGKYRPGGKGGSLIRIRATGNMLLDGTFTVDGGDGGDYANGSGGGGAGGGILLVADTISGAGELRATGGYGPFRETEGAGGGGGGRIAVYWRITDALYDDISQGDLSGVVSKGDIDRFEGTWSVSGGEGWGDGGDGSVRFFWNQPPTGSIIVIR